MEHLNTLTNIGTNRKFPNVVYQTVRDFMPVMRNVTYNGVNVPGKRRLLDSAFPLAAKWENGQDLPEYEAALVDGLRKHVRSDDNVVVIGGGWGVTGVIAARQTSETVHVYEASGEQVTKAQETVSHNATIGKIEFHHAAVGPAKDIWGDFGDAKKITPAKLPTCDILELDCEGAEIDILTELPYRPRVILVETHGHLDCPTASVQSELTSMNYKIVTDRLAEPHMDQKCKEKDIRVLVGIRETIQD